MTNRETLNSFIEQLIPILEIAKSANKIELYSNESIPELLEAVRGLGGGNIAKLTEALKHPLMKDIVENFENVAQGKVDADEIREKIGALRQVPKITYNEVHPVTPRVDDLTIIKEEMDQDFWRKVPEAAIYYFTEHGSKTPPKQLESAVSDEKNYQIQLVQPWYGGISYHLPKSFEQAWIDLNRLGFHPASKTGFLALVNSPLLGTLHDHFVQPSQQSNDFRQQRLWILSEAFNWQKRSTILVLLITRDDESGDIIKSIASMTIDKREVGNGRIMERHDRTWFEVSETPHVLFATQATQNE